MFFCCKVASSSSSSANFLFLFALQAWLARLFCSLIRRYFSSSVSSSILIRLLFVAFVASSTSKVFTSSTFTSLTRKLVVASSTSLGKAELAICVSSIIHLSRSSASLDSTLPLLLLPVLLLLLITSTICSTSVFCSVMCRVVVGKGSGSVKSKEAFSIISIMFVVSSGRGTVFLSIVRFSFSSSIIKSIVGAVLVLCPTVSPRRRSSKLIVLIIAVSLLFSSTWLLSPLKTLVCCFPVVSSPSTSLEVEMLRPSTPQTGVWRQDSCPCAIMVSCDGS